VSNDTIRRSLPRGDEVAPNEEIEAGWLRDMKMNGLLKMRSVSLFFCGSKKFNLNKMKV